MASRFEKGQIVYLCSLLVMVFVILSYLSIQQLNKSNDLRIVDEEIEDQHNLSQEIFKTDVDFFGYELNNRDFYKSGKSVYLSAHDSLMQRFRMVSQQSTRGKETDTTLTLLNQYDSAFKEIVEKIKVRGYEDFGLEGTMRQYAHQLENKKLIPMVELLTLRRHEKDYLLRWNSIYVNEFDDCISRLRLATPTGSSREVLDSYSTSFHELVVLSDSIGLETQSHLKGKLNIIANKLSFRIEHKDREADHEILLSYQRGMVYLSIGIVLSTVLCISLVIIIIRKM